METGLYLPSKPLTVLSPQVSGLSPSLYNGAKEEGTTHAKIYCISSHLLFWDREGPRRLSPKIFKASSPLPHNSDSILNPLIFNILRIYFVDLYILII